jgi:hypothetical protein
MKKILLSLTTVIFCVSSIAQNSASLKMNPEKNRVYRFSSSSEQTILQTVNGNQQTIESKSTNTISIKMVDVTPAFLIAEIRLDSLATKTNTMGKTINMSSTSEGNIQSKETSEIMSYFMNRLCKNPLYAKMDFTGKILEIVNSKMLSDMIMKDTSSITLTGPIAAALKTQIGNMVGENALRNMVEMFTYYLPGKQVSTGENWSVTATTNSGGMSLDIITSFHLDGITGNNANITAESNIRTAANAIPMQQGGATITYDDLKGLSKSAIVIDIRTGFIVEENAKTHIAGNLGLTMPGMSMQIPMDINSESKVVAIQ